MQPRGVNGGSASNTSLIDPKHASPKWASKPSRKPRAIDMTITEGRDKRIDRLGEFEFAEKLDGVSAGFRVATLQIA